VATTSAVVIELQEQLFARERELDSRECEVAVWEDGLVASEHALGRAPWHATPSTSGPRLSDRITWPGRAPLGPVLALL
jgi:hypothetical protein